MSFSSFSCHPLLGALTVYLSRPRLPGTAGWMTLPSASPAQRGWGRKGHLTQHVRKRLKNRPSQPTLRGVSKQEEKDGRLMVPSPTPQYTGPARERHPATAILTDGPQSGRSASSLASGPPRCAAAPSCELTSLTPLPPNPAGRRLLYYWLRRAPTSRLEGQSGRRQARESEVIAES